MYTKRILSAAAAVAVMTTGAMAFDTDDTGRLFKVDIPDNNTTFVLGNYSASATRTPDITDQNLTLGVPGQPGDALIFPAFFSANGWKSEFTVINRSNKAMLAKVVLYSAVDSKELRDFNIYLSANDVFRATLKDGKLVSTDGSTIAEASQTYDSIRNKYIDNGVMASESKPFETTLTEDKGYIAVYGMAQVADVNQTAHTTDPYNIGETYHHKHLELWKDYRHLIDSCRNNGNAKWREGINGGIYTNGIFSPNIKIDDCGNIKSVLINPDTGKADYNTIFESPDNVLIGSIVLVGNDSKGTRAMKLNATPMTNFTVDDANQTLLWTEGEFAALADRAIDDNGSGYAIYSEAQIEKDASAFYVDADLNATNNYIFEFGNSKEDMVIVTQPLKRTLVQLDTINTGTANKNVNGDGLIDATSGIWQNVAFSSAGYLKNYGEFTLNASVYNDNEDYHTISSGSFIVSPANTSTTGAPGEVSLISEFLSDAGYDKGYALLPLRVPAIVTQLSAVDVDGNIETNWIYSSRDN
jgi:hypothetical protein